MPATLNQPIQSFTCKTTNNKTVKFSDLKGQQIVLYFYPKDSTPGCTIESKDFRDHLPEFQKMNTVILGVSRDSLKSHEKFKESCGLPFELISDESEELCRYFNVIGQKQMFGVVKSGLVRSTFLIDANGVLKQEWRNVKVAGHVAEVLAAVRGLLA